MVADPRHRQTGSRPFHIDYPGLTAVDVRAAIDVEMERPVRERGA